MRSVIIAGLLSTAYATQVVDKRQEDDFDSAADALIEAYIPEEQWQSLTVAVADAASEAQVTGEPSAIIYSILKETDPPEWWSDAIPDGYTSEMMALESAIDDLRGDGSGEDGDETVIAVTTTDSDGEDITTSITTTLPPREETVIPVTTTDEDGNDITTSITTSMRPPVTETAVIETETTDEAGNTVTTSVTTTRTTTFTDEEGQPEETDDGDLACMPTAMAKGAAGVAALVGMAMAM